MCVGTVRMPPHLTTFADHRGNPSSGFVPGFPSSSCRPYPTERLHKSRPRGFGGASQSGPSRRLPKMGYGRVLLVPPRIPLFQVSRMPMGPTGPAVGDRLSHAIHGEERPSVSIRVEQQPAISPMIQAPDILRDSSRAALYERVGIWRRMWRPWVLLRLAPPLHHIAEDGEGHTHLPSERLTSVDGNPIPSRGSPPRFD